MENQDINSVEPESKKDERKPKESKKRLPIAIVVLTLLMCFLIGGYMIWKYIKVEAPARALQKELEAEIGLMPGMTEDEIIDRLTRHVAEGRFNASMNSNPTFANGRAKGDVTIENIPGNRYAFNVTVKVVGVNTKLYPEAENYLGQTVMTTGLLEPGSYLMEKKLDVDLPKGEYDCIATFTAYQSEKDADGKDPKEVGATALQIILSVKE